MKKIIALLAVAAFIGSFPNNASAQLQKGNLMLAANLMDIDASFGQNSRFGLNINPKIGYFVEDNIVIGGNVGLHYVTVRNEGNSYTYNVGAFGRYYFSPNEVEPMTNHGRFFGEGDIGVGGDNSASVGFSYGIGPGYSYFITPNIGLEGLVLVHGISGTNSSAGISFGLGFQIYLPTGELKRAYQDKEEQ